MIESDFEELLTKNTELKNHDYKLTINWDLAPKEVRGKLIKDILAMTNIQDGGNILFGVRDKDYEFVGMPEEDFLAFDTAKVNDLLHVYADPKFSCEVYKLKVRGKSTICISVPEFHDAPNICKSNLHASDSKIILRAGTVYVRSEDGKTIEAGAHEMRELLGRAVIKRGDGLLEDIRRLILGKPLIPEKSVDEQYAPEIHDAEAFLFPSIGSKFPHFGGWEVTVYPTNYVRERIARPQDVKKLIESAEVRLRGWYFPHTDKKDASYFSHGFQSAGSGGRHNDGYRAYQSGLFIWKGLLWEDLEEMRDSEKRKVRSFLMVIYEITEFFLFMKRYYGSQPAIDGVHIKLKMGGLANRSLVSLDPAIWLDDGMLSREPAFEYTMDLSIADLKAAADENANRIIQRVFLIFGWDDVSAETIGAYQKKLIERKS